MTLWEDSQVNHNKTDKCVCVCVGGYISVEHFSKEQVLL